MNILVLGDGMVDVYYVGSINRLNPEKHCAPLVDARRPTKFPGGAANVAVNLEKLGATATLVSGAGHIEKHRVIDQSDGVVCRFDIEDGGLTAIRPSKLPDGPFDAVVISDYGKGSIDSTNRSEIIRKYDGTPLYVDTKSDPELWSEHATAMFPNQAEFRKYAREYKFGKLVILKRSSKGATIMKRGMVQHSVPSIATEIKNVAGAGDTVLAAFTIAHCETGDEIKAARFAMMAAAISVSRPVTYAPTRDEILATFKEQL